MWGICHVIWNVLLVRAIIIGSLLHVHKTYNRSVNRSVSLKSLSSFNLTPALVGFAKSFRAQVYICLFCKLLQDPGN